MWRNGKWEIEKYVRNKWCISLTPSPRQKDIFLGKKG